MPITTNELQTLATRGDVAELVPTIRRMINEMREELKSEILTALYGISHRPKFLTAKQFADALAEKPGGRRFTPATIRNWCHWGTLKATQENGAGGVWLIPFSELERIYEDAHLINPARRP